MNSPTEYINNIDANIIEYNYNETKSNITIKIQFTVAAVILEDVLMCHEFQARFTE
jgi:hypothetical protein